MGLVQAKGSDEPAPQSPLRPASRPAWPQLWGTFPRVAILLCVPASGWRLALGWRPVGTFPLSHIQAGPSEGSGPLSTPGSGATTPSGWGGPGWGVRPQMFSPELESVAQPVAVETGARQGAPGGGGLCPDRRRQAHDASEALFWGPKTLVSLRKGQKTAAVNPPPSSFLGPRGTRCAVVGNELSPGAALPGV